MKRLFGKWGDIVANSKTRWITIFIWIICIGIFSYIWPQVNGEETSDNQLLPEDAMSVQASEIKNEEFSSGSGVPLLLVWYRNGGLEESDLEAVQSIYAELVDHPLDHQSFVPPLDEAPVDALFGSASEDNEALSLPVFFDDDASTDELNASLDALQTIIEEKIDSNVVESDLSDDGLHVRFSGPVGIQTDAVSLFSNADITLLVTTVLLVFILLILLYRSPILAIVPLIAVGIAYGLISPLLGYMAHEGWIEFDAQAISIMTVLLFGAGTDYCLFLISRYRDELRIERDKHLALKRAISGTGGAIMMSSMTTVLGLLSLGLAYYASYDRFAVPFSLAIFIMGIAALSVLPAILALLGRFAFIPFIPRPEEMIQDIETKKGKTLRRPKESHRFGKKIGHIVTKKPWTIIVACVIVLGSLASFVPKMQFTYGLLESFPDDMPSREGFTLIEDHYPVGEIAPVDVIIDTDGKDVASLQDDLTALDYVESVDDPDTGSENESIERLEVTLSISPYASEAVEHIPDIQTTVTKNLADVGIDNPEENVWIGGETATLYDTEEITDRDQSVIIPVLLIIIGLLLVVYLRSIVAMIYLLGTVILSYLSALGLGWILLHHVLGVEEIQGLIPVYAFVFLVALGEDYNIFLVSSIWRKRKEMPLKQAISESVGQTGSVISSAGLILAGTFSVLAVLPLQVLVHFGTITAIGILLDTFIVRPLLVPAITTVIGRFAFWPGKLWKLEENDVMKKTNEP